MPWPLQQAKSHLLRFRNSPLKSGSFRWEANSWVRSIWFRRPSRSSTKKDPSLWVSGILNDDPIFAGVAASTVSGALEAFVRAAAIELPKGLRINVGEPH